MKTFEIKISGSGTKDQIFTRLLEFIRELQTKEEDFNSFRIEDNVLYSEITEN